VAVVHFPKKKHNKQVIQFIIISLMSSETDLSRNQAIQNQRNSFSRGFPLPLNVETLQAFGALFQIPQYYRKFLYYKTKMLCNYVINIKNVHTYNGIH
jgi:hypothetical protein